jgi:hypothetical protein
MLERSILVEITTERDGMTLVEDKDIKRAAGPGGPKGRTWISEDPYVKGTSLSDRDPVIQTPSNK